METLKEILTSIGDWFKHRVSNPFYAAFVFAWLSVNWRVALALVSDLEFKEKIDWIDQSLYPHFWQGLAFGLVEPLVLAVAYVMVGPQFFRWMITRYRFQQNRTRDLLLELDRKTLLTAEAADKIRSENIRMKAALKKARQEASEAEDAYFQEISRLTEELTNERAKSLNLATGQEASLKGDVRSNRISMKDVDAEAWGLREELRTRGITKAEAQILMFIQASPVSFATLNELADALSMPVEHVIYPVNELVRLGLVRMPETEDDNRRWLSYGGAEVAAQLVGRAIPK